MTPRPDDNGALELAESAFELVEADAAAAGAVAQRALRMARRQRDPDAEVAALHALSFAQHELGDPQAIRTIRRAVRSGERYGLTRRTALARRRLALDLAGRGAITDAKRQLDLACAALDPHEQARSEVFRIVVLWYAGTVTEPLAGTERALATLRKHGDAFWEAQLLRNRGAVLAERGDAIAAERDLARARELFAGLGATAAAAAAEAELARGALIRGDLPGCLARLDAIDSDDVSPRIAAEVALLRAQATASAHLRNEALEALREAETRWKSAEREDHGGRLEAVRLTLLAGDPVGARTLALQTQRAFAAAGRHVHAARAAGLALAAAIGAREVRPSMLRSGRRAAEILDATGWHGDAQRIRLTVARAAIEIGSAVVARRELDACAGLRRHGRLADRIEARHVEALVRLAGGDRAGAERSARSGLRLLEGYRETLGASDLRATASEIGVELAQLGLRIALAGENAGPVLAWAERLRASAMRLAPVTPPGNPVLRDHQTELRRLSAEIQRDRNAGRASRTLGARQAALEASIRRLARHASGEAGRSMTRLPGRAELSSALGRTGLVELIELDGKLIALTLVEGRLTRRELGDAGGVRGRLEWLRFALTRLARGHQTAAQRAAALAGALADAQALDRELIGPIADVLGDRGLVIVPTGSLHGVPWAILPSLQARPLVVAPSAATWLALARRPRPRRTKVAIVAGPRLRHATSELRAISACYPNHATVLGVRHSTVAAVTSALEGATIAHLACHGHFRTDSPLFSSLELADGSLNVYELQRLKRAPELIVLSACELAVSDTRPGDELLGFAAALIGMGSRTVIASVVPVPDAATKRLMVALHREISSGSSPAVALAKAQSDLRPREAALAGFVCLGAG